jgi:hypothetical protein
VCPISLAQRSLEVGLATISDGMSHPICSVLQPVLAVAKSASWRQRWDYQHVVRVMCINILWRVVLLLVVRSGMTLLGCYGRLEHY